MSRKTGLIVIIAGLIFGAGAIAGVLQIADHHHDDSTIVNHGGGLDSCGGHHNRKTGTYHYHRGPYC